MGAHRVKKETSTKEVARRTHSLSWESAHESSSGLRIHGDCWQCHKPPWRDSTVEVSSEYGELQCVGEALRLHSSCKRGKLASRHLAESPSDFQTQNNCLVHLSRGC